MPCNYQMKNNIQCFKYAALVECSGERTSLTLHLRSQLSASEHINLVGFRKACSHQLSSPPPQTFKINVNTMPQCFHYAAVCELHLFTVLESAQHSQVIYLWQYPLLER